MAVVVVVVAVVVVAVVVVMADSFFFPGSTSVAQYGLTCYVDEDGLELVAILLVQCCRC